MSIKISILRAFVMLLFVAFVGCAEDDLYSDMVVEREAVECGVVMGIELPTLIGNATRGGDMIYPLSNVVEGVVKNVWILQYDENDKFIGSATYVEGLELDDVESGDITVRSVNLLNSNNLDHSIVFVANTFDNELFKNENRENFSTLELLKELNYPIVNKVGDGYVDNCGLREDSEGKNYIVMSDIVKAKVNSDDINCELEYNLAKISLNIKNENATYIPETIALMGVPAVATYVTGYDLPEEYPTKDKFKPTNYNSIDLSSVDLASGAVFVFYMPANMRGEVTPDNDTVEILQENKPLYADNYNTFVEVVGAKIDDANGDNVKYKFYLGANLTTDFNIKPNYQYDYDITLKDFDEETILVDSRVEVSNENIFDYTRERPSNCYILNPSESSDRYYYIPIKKRINEFWGGNGYESVANNVIYEGDEDYSVELSWHDYTIDQFDDISNMTDNPNLSEMVSLDDINFIVTFDERDYTAPSQLTAMKVTLKKGATEGNVVVNIVRDGRILWSWHFWITHYNPYSVARYKSKYAMEVEGGEIHSYAGAAWDGPYAGHFIMDRDIGAKDSNDGTLSLLYQFGRKDPFRVFGSVAGYYTSESHSPYGYYQVVKSTPITMAEMVLDPTKFYTYDNVNERYVFPKTGKYNNKTIVWCDPKIELDKEGINKKSIFDPSPLGWMVPTPYIWLDFQDKAKSASYDYNSDQKILEGAGKKRGGRFYNPSATTISPAKIDNYVAYYPENGTILNYTGAYQFGDSGYAWTSNANYPYNNGQAYMMLFRSYESITAYFNYYRWNGRAVRPVTE